MPYAKLTATFENEVEVRMGSPFRYADLQLYGPWVPDLPDYDWQNIAVESSNGRYLALVAWAMSDNKDPGFRIVVIDKKDKQIRQSSRISGCCKSLRCTPTGVSVEIYSLIQMSELSDISS